MKIHKPTAIDVEGQDLVPGRMVFYQTDGRNELSYTLPAIVTVTRDSHPGDYPDGRKNPLSVLDDDGYEVHLTVFTPGGVGTTVMVDDSATGHVPFESRGTENFPDAMEMDVSQASGTYVEHNVPYDPDGGPRTWRWMR